MKILLTILSVIAIYFTFSVALHRQEVHECLTWQEQAEQYPAFYLTDWQEEQCKSVNIYVK